MYSEDASAWIRLRIASFGKLLLALFLMLMLPAGLEAQSVTFSDANWISMPGLSPGGTISAVAVDDSGSICIGGQFSLHYVYDDVAIWDGSSWSTLGSGMNGAYPFVNSLAVSGTNLYAAGGFTTAGSNVVNCIAKWDGNTWSAIGVGIDGGFPIVFALAVSDTNVYVGGRFTTAGGIAATNIAKWDGSSWSALGGGMNSNVYALAVSGSDLYAGGAFTTAGGITANHIAKWDGSSWSALGGGMNSNVHALAVSGSDLYAGGLFTTAGGSAASCIAKWDGNSWSALGSGMGAGANPYYSPSVSALAVSGSNVYVGGRFATAGGITANYIAKWDGSSWSALGSGMDFIVNALAVSGNDLYAGGQFYTAGGKVSPHIARAYLPTLPTLSLLDSGTNVIVSWPSTDTAGFVLEQVGTLAASASWVTNTASVSDDGTNKSVTLPATDKPQFFRLRGP